MGTPPIMTVTDNAAARVRELLASRGKPSAGIRVGLRTAGCSGMSYTIEYSDEPSPYDEVVEIAPETGDDAVKVFVDPKATLYLIGTEMDFVEEKLQSGFVFRNPNEKGRCGCGESFHV